MKNKDYVSQPKQKRPKPPKESTPPKRPFPILKAIIVLSLVAGFGYFLLNIKDDGLTTDGANPETKPDVVKKQAVPPPPEDETWTFIEELENKKVKVTADELEDKGPFLMQCASLRHADQAESLKAKIAFAGFESQVKRVEGSSGVWYKVILGPFDRKRDAEKTRHVLKGNNINYCEIWLWR